MIDVDAFPIDHFINVCRDESSARVGRRGHHRWARDFLVTTGLLYDPHSPYLKQQPAERHASGDSTVAGPKDAWDALSESAVARGYSLEELNDAYVRLSRMIEQRIEERGMREETVVYRDPEENESLSVCALDVLHWYVVPVRLAVLASWGNEKIKEFFEGPTPDAVLGD